MGKAHGYIGEWESGPAFSMLRRHPSGKRMMEGQTPGCEGRAPCHLLCAPPLSFSLDEELPLEAQAFREARVCRLLEGEV